MVTRVRPQRHSAWAEARSTGACNNMVC